MISTARTRTDTSFDTFEVDGRKLPFLDIGRYAFVAWPAAEMALHCGIEKAGADRAVFHSPPPEAGRLGHVGGIEHEYTARRPRIPDYSRCQEKTPAHHRLFPLRRGGFMGPAQRLHGPDGAVHPFPRRPALRQDTQGQRDSHRRLRQQGRGGRRSRPRLRRLRDSHPGLSALGLLSGSRKEAAPTDIEDHGAPAIGPVRFGQGGHDRQAHRRQVPHGGLDNEDGRLLPRRGAHRGGRDGIGHPLRRHRPRRGPPRERRGEIPASPLPRLHRQLDELVRHHA